MSVLALSAFVTFSLTAPALAAGFSVTGTDNSTKTIGSVAPTIDTGTVANGATLSIPSGGTAAITWNSGSVVITNAGLIQQAGSGRGINTTGAVN